MKKAFALVAGALALAAPHAPAFAAVQKAPAKAAPSPAAKPLADAPPTEEQQEHGVQTFGLIASAVQSKNVPDDLKAVLMQCVYGNSVRKISDGLDKVIAANPGKIDRTKPEQMLSVLARICGYEPPATPAATPGAPQGSAPTTAPVGR
mgnify:CR=1 FL=1